MLALSLSKLANCRSQFLLVWEMFVLSESTSCHKFASQFGLAICFIREKHTQPSETGSPSCVYFNETATAIVGRGTGRHGWAPPTEPGRSTLYLSTSVLKYNL